MNRKEDFKTGLGSGKDVTQRHVERYNGIRKQKRERALARIRYEDAGKGGNAFDLAFKSYTPQALCVQHDPNALNMLRKCLHEGDDDQINTNLFKLLGYSDQHGSPVIRLLVQLVSGNNQAAGTMAMNCLVNLTGAKIEPTHQPLLAQLIIEAQFLDAATAHITDDTILAKDCWYVVANLISLCETSRDVVLSCTLFKNVHRDEHWKSPFLSEMQRGRPEYDILIFTVVCAAFETGNTLPDFAFCFATLLFVIKSLTLNWHAPRKESTAEPDRVLSLSLSALAYFAEKCVSTNVRHVELFAKVFGEAERKLRGFTFLFDLAPRVNKVNQRRLLRVFVKAGKFNDTSLALQNLMQQSGAIQLMLRFAQDPDVALQREALVWLGNYASENIEFVRHIHALDGFRTVAQCLRRAPTHDVRNSAVYCLMQACNICTSFPHGEAEQVIIYLLQQCKLVSITCQHLGDVGDPQLTVDILETWLALLQWNREEVSRDIEDHGGQDKVEMLLGVTGNMGDRIFKLAEQVLDLLSTGSQSMDFDLDGPPPLVTGGNNKFFF